MSKTKFYAPADLKMSFAKPPDGEVVDVDFSGGSYETDDEYVIAVLQADAADEASPVTDKPPKSPSKE